MPLASPDKATSHGATWPDVGLAIVEFAREDPWTFVGVLGAIGVILWLLFPRATRGLQEAYRISRLAQREEARKSSSPAGDGSND